MYFAYDLHTINPMFTPSSGGSSFTEEYYWKSQFVTCTLSAIDDNM